MWARKSQTVLEASRKVDWMPFGLLPPTPTSQNGVTLLSTWPQGEEKVFLRKETLTLQRRRSEGPPRAGPVPEEAAPSAPTAMRPQQSSNLSCIN